MATIDQLMPLLQILVYAILGTIPSPPPLAAAQQSPVLNHAGNSSSAWMAMGIAIVAVCRK